MRFNISEFREHIEQMTNITTEETQKFVGSKVDELSKRDFDFAGTRTIGDFDKKTPTFRENNPARVAAYFSDDFIKRKNVMKEMASTISLIENIEPLSNKSRKGEWVERYASKSREEIIDFVIKKDRSIKQEHLQKMLLGETANPETDQKIAIKYLAKKHKLKEATLTKLVKTSGFLASDKDTNPQMTKEQKLFKFALSVGKLTGPEAKPYLNATEELRASKDTSLGPRSPTYRLFMNHDSDKLVRIFLQAEKDAKKDPEKKSHEAAIDMNKLLKDAPPEMLFKIREVGQKLKLKSEEEPRQSWIKRVKSSFSAWLNKSKDKQILDELTAGGVIKITKASDIRQALTASPKPKASHSTGQHVAIRNIGIDF